MSSLALLAVGALGASMAAPTAGAPSASTTWFEGEGDVEYLKALDISFRTYTADAEYQVATPSAPR